MPTGNFTGAPSTAAPTTTGTGLQFPTRVYPISLPPTEVAPPTCPTVVVPARVCVSVTAGSQPCPGYICPTPKQPYLAVFSETMIKRM
jgi:hypothetical protein